MKRRPDPPHEPPEGCRYVVAPDDDWRVVTGGRCRRTHRKDGWMERCDGRAVAMLKRGKSGWWRYCADHLYGRWIEDGRVVGWRLVPDPHYESTEMVGPRDAG